MQTLKYMELNLQSQNKSNSAISSKESPSKKKSAKAKKVTATNLKPTDAQLKKATKRIKKEFHASHASGSGDGTDFKSGVPDEQRRKTLGTDEGSGTKLGVLDVPNYDSESEKESWGDSREEDNDDENNSEEDSDGNDDNDDNNDDDDDGNGGDGGGDDDDDANDEDNQEDDDTYNDDEETDSDRTESDRIKIHVLNQSSNEYYEEEEYKIDDEEKMDEEEDDEVTKEMYNDVNVNLGNRDVDMTDKTDEPVQSSYVSSNFTSKLLNLENPSLADNEIAFLIDTTARHEEPRSQTSSLYIVSITATPEVTSIFTTIIPPPPPSLNPLPQQATPTPTPITYEATTSFSSLLDFSSIFKFNDISILINKDVFDTYGEVFTLKRSRDDRDKDQDPSTGSDRGTKRRKLSKEAESSRDSRSKEKKSSRTFKDTSQSQYKRSGKSNHAEEPSHTVDDSGVQHDQEFDKGNNDEQPTNKEVSKAD
nr:hypothetical protein [Tanacetum cinerariifolium]